MVCGLEGVGVREVGGEVGGDVGKEGIVGRGRVGGGGVLVASVVVVVGFGGEGVEVAGLGGGHCRSAVGG